MEVQISREVSKTIKAEGISEAELTVMVTKAAITSVRGFNRRYFQWLFKVKDGVVERMEPAEVVEVLEPGDAMEEDCDLCEGAGCAKCHFIGTVWRRVVDTTALNMQAALASATRPYTARQAFR